MTTRLHHLTVVNVLLFSLGIWVLPATAADPSDVPHQADPVLPTWAQVRSVPMRGDFKAFWNVGGGDVEYNNREAVAHGFRLVHLLNTYADYPGQQKESIANAQRGNRTNPWKKPDYFERIVRRNTAQARRDGGLADTGSVLEAEGEGGKLYASLLPEVHLAILHESDIYPSLENAIHLTRETRSAVFITGPSRTGDIEMSHTIGVHGPGEIVVFLVP